MTDEHQPSSKDHRWKLSKWLGINETSTTKAHSAQQKALDDERKDHGIADHQAVEQDHFKRLSLAIQEETKRKHQHN